MSGIGDATLIDMEDVISKSSRRYSVQEYLHLEAQSSQRHEFRDGEIVAMAGGTFNHAAVAANLITALNRRLSGMSCRAVGSDMRVRAQADARYTYPDVTVICGQPQFDPRDEKQTTVTNPRIICEVLSPTTGLADRSEKLSRYLKLESLEEYILVPQSMPRVESLHRQPDGSWSLAFCDGIESPLKVRCLGLQIPLTEIYAGVELTPD